MTTEAPAADQAAIPVRAPRSASTLIARYTARRSVRSAALWGYVFGIMVASSAYSYTRIYQTAAERARLAGTFGRDHAASALFGPASQLNTVAGFTVFKVSMTLMIIAAVWGLLTSTRLLRGDEDAGRWEILIGGPVTRGRGVAQVLAGLGAGAAVLWAVTAVITVLAGRLSSVRIAAPAGLFLALALVASAVVFLAVGAVTSQLAPSRRQAAGYAAVVLGISYGLRMVADADAGLHWLVWTSPLGWMEELQPLTRPRPWALAPIAACTAVLAVLAVYLAGHRDAGASIWPDRTTRPPRLRLLSGPAGLAVRLTGGPVVSWAAGLGIAGLLLGIVAKAAGTTITGSSVQQIFARLGAPGSGTATFLGIAFVIIAIVLAFEAATLLNAVRAEEADGRLDQLLAAAVSRSRWFTARLAVAAGALVLSGAAAGLLAWAGTVAQGTGPGFAAVVEAGLNTIPPALFLLGVGALAFGVRPRLASIAVYAVLGWSALIELAGGFFTQDHWVLDTSLFHQMASAPAVAPDGLTDGVLTGLGLLGLLLGGLALRRRDLQGE